MLAILFTKAQSAAQLDQDLAQWKASYGGTKPALILGPHELVYVLASSPRAGERATPSGNETYDGIEITCLCELAHEHNGDLECHDLFVDEDDD